MHAGQEGDGVGARGPVVVQAEVVGGVGGGEVQEGGYPGLACGVVGAGGRDELVGVGSAEGHHLGGPEGGGVLRRDGGALGLVEEVDDELFGGEDVLPVAAGELGFEADHGAEGGAVFESGGGKGE